jgi:hypothetical protein
MSLTSLNLPLVSSNDLLQTSDSVRGDGPNGEILSEVDKVKAINPETAFLPQDMYALKENVAERLAQLNLSDSSSIGDLESKIAVLSTSQLSKVLYDSGVDPEDFSIEEFDLSVENLQDLSFSIDAFNNLIAGGCEALRKTLDTAKTPKEISLETFDDTNGAYSVEAQKTSTVLLKEAEEAAKSAADAVISQIDTFLSIDTASLRAAAESKTTAITSTFNKNISDILTDVKKDLSSLKSTTEQCSQDTKKTIESKMKNLDKNADNLSNKVTDVSATSLAPTIKLMKDKVARTKSLVNDENNKKRETITAALIKKYQENNPQASPEQIKQSVQNMVGKANKQSDEKIKKESDVITNLVNRAKAKYKDISNASNQKLASSASAGRPVAEKTSILSNFAKFSTQEQIFDASYFLGPYAKRIAEAVNSLHPKVRLRFANAIKDVLYDDEVLAMNGTAYYSFALRSFSAQADLREAADNGGARAAKAGNSWHEFGCAADIVFVINGQPKYDEKFYTGLIRGHFASHNLENNFGDDPQHFQPKEFRTQGIELPQTVKKKIIKDGSIDKKVVASYIR